MRFNGLSTSTIFPLLIFKQSKQTIMAKVKSEIIGKAERKFCEYLLGKGTPFHRKLIDAMMVANEKHLARMCIVYPYLVAVVHIYRNDPLTFLMVIDEWNRIHANDCSMLITQQMANE